ncbi:MAG TPA: molybdopterin cofactor-binding domain-containing protein [Roseiflexaceae bacterium]|nr:molybdopterin cofactor-binding domain-containing protein [Roseiflexaceae bacterium]
MAYASLIGARVRRKEDPRLITGAGTYTGDLKLPGMHHVAFVRSPYPHARIRGIDASAALRRPGVVTVVRGEDLVDAYTTMPFSGGEGASADKSKQTLSHYAISVGKVRHTGEIVAAVIATNLAAAADGAAEVLVDYEPLPAVVDMEQAARPDAPRLFDELESNVDHVWQRKHGDVEAAFAAAHRVVRLRMNNQRLAGVPMEGRAVVAAPDFTTGGLTVWTSTQAAHWIRRDLAEMLGLHENQVRVIAPEVGGGFGVKIGIYPEEAALAALARAHCLPLRWVEGRLEHMQATTHGRAQLAEYEAAVAEDGTVTALRARILADVGAYPVAAGIPDLTGEMFVGVYKIPAVDVAITCVYTNTTPVAAYRGAGRPEAAYYIERMMDAIARELGMDPAEVRRRNFIPPEAFPYRTPVGTLYDTGEYDKPLTKALEISGYAALREEQRRRRAEAAPRSLLGIGLTTYVEMCGFGPYESAHVRVEPSGTVTVLTGISPHGQGNVTTFCQIVADQLGVPFDQVVVKWGDTAVTPMGNGTMGSRSLAVGGGALVRAVEQVRNKARRIAAHMLEAAVDDVVLHEGRYQVKGAPDSALTLKQIADRAYSDELPDDITPGLESTDYFKPPELIYPFGAHVAVVEVEVETGEVRVRAYYSVDDCGPRISPMIVAGQVHGGLAQGISQALLEEVVYSESGQLLSGTLMDYTLPRADDLPSFTLDSTVTPTPHNPLGAKGIGEAATIGSTPAIVNAVVDALSHLGVTHLDMPLRSERVWRAIHGADVMRNA